MSQSHGGVVHLRSTATSNVIFVAICILFAVRCTFTYGSKLHFAAPRLSRKKDASKNISPRTQFQGATLGESMEMSDAVTPAISRMLAGNSANPYGNGMQDMDQYYDSYQLAWRLLGFYVDCNYSDGDGENGRFLSSDNEECKRMVLYGVYVDPSHEGGGIGEYEYYSKHDHRWSCYGDACRTKMDCHLPDTDWKMLGIFKIDNIGEDNGWMEQLFKHEGVCIWTEDEYELANDGREIFPDKCTSTGYDDSNGVALYYHTKPGMNGQITLGLYTDAACLVEYAGDDKLDVFSMAGIDASFVDSFNYALESYKICQPCISYDLSAEDFRCYDEAGYENCDQCMKFALMSGGLSASMNDIILASRQQTLVGFELNGVTYGSGGWGRHVTDPVQMAKARLIQNKQGSKEWKYIKKEALAWHVNHFTFFGVSCAILLFGIGLFVVATIVYFKEVYKKSSPLLEATETGKSGNTNNSHPHENIERDYFPPAPSHPGQIKKLKEKMHQSRERNRSRSRSRSRSCSRSRRKSKSRKRSMSRPRSKSKPRSSKRKSDKS